MIDKSDWGGGGGIIGVFKIQVGDSIDFARSGEPDAVVPVKNATAIQESRHCCTTYSGVVGRCLLAILYLQ